MLDEALSLRQSIGDKVGEVYTRNLLGSCFQALKKDDEALSNYKQALAISRELGDKSGEVLALYNLAYFEQSKKNYLSSIVFIESAIKIIESTRNKFFNKDFQTSFFASNQKFYGLYIESLMFLYQIDPKAGYHIKAFEISEKARARSLLDSIKSINAQVYADINPELVKQQLELENQLSFLTEQIIKVKNRSHTNEELVSLETEFNEAKGKLELLETEIASKNPRYNNLTKPVPLVLKEIQEKVLDSDSILIQYFLGDKSSYVWAITEREFFAYSLPNRQEIETLSDKIYSLLTVRNSQQIYESLKEKAAKVEKAEQNYLTLSLELSKIILSPIEQHLGNKKRILLCADGKLHFIPFATLPLTTAKNFTHLVANYEISNLPSASTISLIREQIETKLNNVANSRILVVADPIFSAEDSRIAKTQTHENIVLTDPDFNQVGIRGNLNLDRLPFTRKEAEGITTVFEDKVTQLLDQNANKENIKQSDLTQYGAIHFATHSITDNEHPEFSSIVLSLVDEKGQTKPGFLTIADIFKLKTSAQVITLSACSTGLGKEKRGEGIIGLARAFMYSGTPRVVATLWSINDEVTSEFMISFYQHLKKGMSPNTALRQAQLVTIKKDKFKSPYYWGAFIIQGEFR